MPTRRVTALTVILLSLWLGQGAVAQTTTISSTTSTTSTSTSTTRPVLPPCLPGSPEQFGLPPTSTSIPCDPRGPQVDPNAPPLPLCRDIPGGAASGQLCVEVIISGTEPPPTTIAPRAARPAPTTPSRRIALTG